MMKLGVAMVLSVLLEVSQAGPVANSSATGGAMEAHHGPCYQEYMHCQEEGGACCPQCDDHGYFLSKQCSKLRGCCWCVDAKTGKMVPNTETMAGSTLDCGASMYCPYDWHYYDGRCFMFVESPKSWCEAEKYCQFNGGNLASVHSYQEYHYLQAMTVSDAHQFQETWLGGHDSVKPGFWMWCDGSKFYHEYWCREDEYEKEGCCVKMNYGFDKKWAAANCSSALPFICSKASYNSYDSYMMKDSM